MKERRARPALGSGQALGLGPAGGQAARCTTTALARASSSLPWKPRARDRGKGFWARVCGPTGPGAGRETHLKPSALAALSKGEAEQPQSPRLNPAAATLMESRDESWQSE